MTLLLLQWLTLRGRVRRSLRLLRQPKYAIGTAIGGLWLFFWLVRPVLGARVHAVGLQGLDALTGDMLPTMRLVAAFGITVFMATPWLVPWGRLGLKFREAELTLLLQAPLSRRRLIAYGLRKSSLGVALTALVLAIVLAPGAAPDRLRAFLGLWLLFVLWDLNSKWRAQFLLRQREIAPRAAHMRRAVLTVALLGLVVVLAVAAIEWIAALAAATRGVDAVNMPAALIAMDPPPLLVAVTRPGALLTAPALASDWPSLLLTSLPVLLLVVVQRELVLRSPARFEETALEHARAEEVKRSPTRRYVRASGRSRRAAAFALPPTGRAETAVLWKNVMRISRIPFWQIALGSLASLAAMAFVPPALGVPAAFHGVVMAAALPVAFFSVFMGGMVWHNDLRADLAHLELVRTWPVSADRFVLAQVLSPALLGFLGATFAVGLALAAWVGTVVRLATGGDAGGVEFLPVDGPLLGVAPTLAALLAAAGALPLLAGMAFLSSAFQNLAVMLAPAWMGRSESPRGIAAFGQRLVFSTGLFLAFALTMIPGAVLVALAVVAQHLAGLGTTAWVLPLWGVLAAAPPVVAGLVAVHAAARAWTRLDASSEILESGG